MKRTVLILERRIEHLNKRLETDIYKKLTYDREERAAMKFLLELLSTLVQENNVFRRLLKVEEGFEDVEDQSEIFGSDY